MVDLTCCIAGISMLLTFSVVPFKLCTSYEHVVLVANCKLKILTFQSRGPVMRIFAIGILLRLAKRGGGGGAAVIYLMPDICNGGSIVIGW